MQYWLYYSICCFFHFQLTENLLVGNDFYWRCTSKKCFSAFPHIFILTLADLTKNYFSLLSSEGNLNSSTRLRCAKCLGVSLECESLRGLLLILPKNLNWLRSKNWPAAARLRKMPKPSWPNGEELNDHLDAAGNVGNAQGATAPGRNGCTFQTAKGGHLKVSTASLDRAAKLMNEDVEPRDAGPVQLSTGSGRKDSSACGQAGHKAVGGSKRPALHEGGPLQHNKRPNLNASGASLNGSSELPFSATRTDWNGQPSRLALSGTDQMWRPLPGIGAGLSGGLSSLPGLPGVGGAQTPVRSSLQQLSVPFSPHPSSPAAGNHSFHTPTTNHRSTSGASSSFSGPSPIAMATQTQFNGQQFSAPFASSPRSIEHRNQPQCPLQQQRQNENQQRQNENQQQQQQQQQKCRGQRTEEQRGQVQNVPKDSHVGGERGGSNFGGVGVGMGKQQPSSQQQSSNEQQQQVCVDVCVCARACVCMSVCVRESVCARTHLCWGVQQRSAKPPVNGPIQWARGTRHRPYVE